MSERIITPADKKSALLRMNRRLAVVKEGGQTLVISEDYNPVLKRRETNRSTFPSISNFYHDKVKGEKESEWTTLGKWWLEHPNRRQYEGVIFAPNDTDLPTDYYNLWRGFAVEPKQGDWSLYQDHILNIICSNDYDIYCYVMAWLAQGVQTPHVKPEVAIILRSEERGTGKTFFTKYYRQLFGQHGLEISNPAHLTGKFNGHLEDCCVLVISEAFWAGSHQSEAVLKSLITEDRIAIERKGLELRFAQSYLRVLMTSNSEWVVPAGLDERRFLVLDVSTEHKQDTQYFGAIAEQMENGGMSAMLYDLQRYDCSTVNLRSAPSTDALMDQKILSLDPRDRWLFGKLEGGRLLEDDTEWLPEVPRFSLHESYCAELQQTGVSRRRTETELGMYLKKLFRSSLRETRPKGVRCWIFPDLPTCRQIFAEKIGTGYKWPAYDGESKTRSNSAKQPINLNSYRQRKVR